MKRFLYKIYSRYDGFRPDRIPARRDDSGRLVLGWRRYIDVLERGSEVWVYFHGHRSFRPGVYAKGSVVGIDPDHEQVLLRLREWSTDDPLTDEQTNAGVAEAVAQRGRQVFFLPENLRPTAECNLDNCGGRKCGDCPRWMSLPLMEEDHYELPRRLRRRVGLFVPAYWVLPSRNFLYLNRLPVAEGVRQSSDLFYQFKAGEEALSYPLALGMYQCLRERDDLDFDAIVPIPLSPDKEGELHRARVLAEELSRLIGVPTVEALSLEGPISKRRLRNRGWSAADFEARYLELLRVDDSAVADPGRLLLVDDVCDHGSTLRCGVRELKSTWPNAQVAAASAGQMAIREAVPNEAPLLASHG